MRNIFESADQYCKESNWKTIAALKMCLIAMGMIIGMFVPKKSRKVVVPVCGTVFVGTVVPLMKKYFDILTEDQQ